MRISLIYVGKTDEQYILNGIAKYRDRLKHYTKFDEILISDVKNSKNLTEFEQKDKEAIAILKNLDKQDTVVLLDEGGKMYSSVGFAEYLEKAMIGNVQHLVFVVGGPYGFSDSMYQRANAKMSLSKMTFSHQMVRLFFVEQVYRAFSIIRGEPYHHR